MQRASKSVMAVFALLVPSLVGAAVASADGNGSGGAAPSGRTAGVVLVTGSASQWHREIAGQTIEAAVRDAGWSLPPTPLTKSQSDSMLTCFDSKSPASCLPASLRSARIFIVTVETQADNGVPMVVLTGKAIMIDPPSTAIRQQHCERCAGNDLTAASVELAKIVLQDLVLRAGTTFADFRTVPEGAIIVLDGQRIGATSSKFNIYPGKHLARFEKPGYLAVTREFTAVEGESVRVADTLQPSGSGKPPIRPPSKLLPGILLGAGGVLGATGAIWIFQYGTKGDSGDRYRYSRATPLGIGAAALGLGTAGAGAYLLWKGSRSSAPTADVTSSGAVLGWMGIFR